MKNINKMFDTKRGSLYFSLSLLFGIFAPFLLIKMLSSIFPFASSTFELKTIIHNGILFVLVFTTYGFFKKESFLHLILGLAYICLLYYFYSVGSNVFTLYLPHLDFGYAYISSGESLLTIEYKIFIYFFFAIKLLFLLRDYINSKKENEIKRKAPQK